MELRTTRQMRRNEQLSKTMAKRAETADAPAQSKPAQPQPPADKLSVSRQALAWLEEQNRKMWEQEERRQRQQSRVNDSLSALDSAKKELDAMGKQLKVMNKCQKIAAAIMRGDRVPPEDLEYLMNNDPDGYKLAMAMRREKKDPEDVESVLDEEDRGGGSVEEADSGGEAPGVESAGPSEGGGETSAPAE